MSNTTVLRAVDRLLDDGLIQFLHMVPSGRGSWKRRYRVTHPDHVEAQRAAIEVFGMAPSERAKRMTHYAGEEGVDDDVVYEEAASIPC